MSEETRLARIGDFLVCRCLLPVPYQITIEILSPQAAAEINEDLLSSAPMWEFNTNLSPQ